MRSGRDRLVALVVLLVLSAVALTVVLSLGAAERQAIDALEESLDAEVAAISRSLNQRIDSQIATTIEFGNSGDFEFAVGSDADQEALDDLVESFGSVLESGFLVLDESGRIASAILLRDRALIGEPYERAGFSTTLPAGVLPVAPEGLTTAQPNFATFAAVVEPESSRLLGFFVSETVVGPDAPLSEEIVQLNRGETGRYQLTDTMGTVIASSDPSSIAAPITDDRMMALDTGVHSVDRSVVAVAPVPTAGWRLLFSQDRGEFTDGVTGPIQLVVVLVALALVVVAVIMVLFLVRQLRRSREEERRLRALNEIQQDFISIVSHEVRTPMAGVVGFLESTIDHWNSMDDEERLRGVERAAHNASRLQSLTRDVLDARALETGDLTFVLADIDPRAVLEQTVATARGVYPDHTVELDAPATLPAVRVDPDRLQQVLTNLMDNAVKNSTVEQPIRVSAAVEASELVTTVRDDGVGISPEIVERVFEKFVRERPDAVAGSGLGLYIARRVVDELGGRIWVESAPGAGAAFSFALPIVDATEHAGRAESGSVDVDR